MDAFLVTQPPHLPDYQSDSDDSATSDTTASSEADADDESDACMAPLQRDDELWHRSVPATTASSLPPWLGGCCRRRRHPRRPHRGMRWSQRLGPAAVEKRPVRCGQFNWGVCFLVDVACLCAVLVYVAVWHPQLFDTKTRALLVATTVVLALAAVWAMSGWRN